ncbi:MAG: hypothetical protein JNK74_11230 [Candidatus Hydrogenedentes bacterium]|nr:hypothetical protein [Candidatus Hydrogenedentota bacterium]
MNAHNRRTFLKGATALGLAGFADVTRAAYGAEKISTESTLKVRIKADGEPLVARGFAILKDRIEQRCAVRVVEGRSGATVILTVDEKLPPEAFRIDEKRGAVRVAGGSPSGLLYGIGKFLRTSGYDGGFQPSSWRGTSAPQGSLRGMYFASHFHNWYHEAPEAEVIRYMEDLSLWGVNAIMVIFPMINLQGWDDPEAEPAMAKLRQYVVSARELGLQFVTGLNNCMFIGAPQDIRAGRLPDPTKRRGNSGHPICPSNPKGHAYLMENTEKLYQRLADVGLDLVCMWPYDEGGCSCDQCAPWGSNGYVKISRDLTLLGRKYFPNLKTIVSTWMFDTPPEGEWQGLTDVLARQNDWASYILADSHEDFPRYPLDVTVPGNLPLINFPEISMWGNSPWGGVGAHPLPARFQRLWDQVKHKVEGGFPYSEGIYEDMSKAIVLQFYWNRDQSARATLEEYIAYEFGSGVTEDVLALVELLESAVGRAFRKEPADKEAVERAFALAEGVHARLPEWARTSWRWEILHLRALLDRERFAGAGLESPTAEAALLRLVEIYHCQLETDDPYHHRVRPRLRQAVDRAGRK